MDFAQDPDSDEDAEPSPILLAGPRLTLHLPPPTDAGKVLAYFWMNRAHLGPWSPPAPPGYYTEEFWRYRLEENRDEYLEDRSVRFFAVRSGDPDRIVGNVSLTNIRRGALQAANLGYGLAGDVVGHGLMTEALGLTIAFAFGRLSLHRLEANHMPDNDRSSRLLERHGFVVEGFAKDYLYIDGRWRDHVLTALSNPSLESPGVHRTG